MRQVSYAGQTFVTTDAMAGAVVDFTAAIAATGDSESLTVPALDEHRTPMSVDLVLGPASEVLSVPFDGGDDDLDTETAVRTLQERTVRLASARSRRPEGQPLDEPVPTLDDIET